MSNLWMNKKLETTKTQFVCILLYLQYINRKFEFLIFQGSVATCLMRDGYCLRDL